MRTLSVSIRMTIVLTVLLGLLYPVVMTVAAKVLFPYQANGSLIVRDSRVVGSRLLGQNFAGQSNFHGRPSAAGDKGYDATSSSGSNLAPTNKLLIEAVGKRLKETIETEGEVPASEVPIDLVTASGSGLDPEISPAAAELQVRRVARVRGLDPTLVRELVRENTRGRWAGIFGEPGVNVLMLNLALDRLNREHR